MRLDRKGFLVLRALVSAIAWATIFAPRLSVFAEEPSSCSHRSVRVGAFNAAWEPVSGLDVRDFQGEMSKAFVSIASVVPDERPHRIVILLDASGSMVGNSKNDEWTLALNVASHLVNASLPKTSFALIVFSAKILEEVDFSAGPLAVRDKIIQIAGEPAFVRNKIRGQTALFDAAYAGLRLLDHPSSADSLYLISDGDDNASKMSPRELKRALISSGVRLNAVIFAPSFPSPATRTTMLGSPEGPQMLSEIIKATGGMTLGPLGVLLPIGRMDYSLEAYDRKSLDASLNRFYRSILTNYLVEVDLPPVIDQKGELKLDLTQAARQKSSKAVLIYQHLLATCSAELTTK